MSRMAALQRVQACVAARDARALVAELRANLGDATVAEHALRELFYLLPRSRARCAPGTVADAVLAALRAHAVDPRVARWALLTLDQVYEDADEAQLSSAAAACSEAVFAALRLHSADAALVAAACMFIRTICSDDFDIADVMVGIAPDAVDVLTSALRTHLNNPAAAGHALHALSSLFTRSQEAARGLDAGCVELALAAMRAFPNAEAIHTFACRALAHVCFGAPYGGAFSPLAGSSAIDAVYVSLRRFPDCAPVQVNGMKALWLYMYTGSECLGEAAALAALVALQRHSQDVDVLGLTFDMLHLLGLKAPAGPSSWLLATLGTTEAVALLKRSLARLERAGKCTPDHAALVHRMTYGACAGCGELQEAKMKRCARCERAAYCSADCQRSHWAVHKRECVRPPSSAAGQSSAGAV